MGRRIVRTVAIFALLFAAGICLIYFGTRSDAVTVARSIKSGVLTADTVDVAFQNVGGRLTKRLVNESDRVKAGDPLLVLDGVAPRNSIEKPHAVLALQRAALEEAKLAKSIAVHQADLTELSSWRQIEEIEAALKAARSGLKLARDEWRRAETLFKTGGVSKSAFDTALNNLHQAQSSLTQTERSLASAVIGAKEEELQKLEKTGSAEGMTLLSVQNAREEIVNRDNAIAQLEASLRQSEADLKQLEVDESRLTLTSPDSGRVLAVYYQPGDMVSASASTVLLETERLYFDFYVNESLVTQFREGTQVTAKVPALGTTVRGTVRIATAAPSFADLRSTRERGQADYTNYKIRVYVEPVPELLTGMTLEVEAKL